MSMIFPIAKYFLKAAANRIWDAPTADEIAAVEAAAWAQADADETELYWGVETITR